MSSQAASQPKTRTRGFSGCWTCRAKHLKCDESKPTCKRCQRAGRECEGYGVRLNWTSVRLPSNFGKRGSKRGRPTPLFEVSRFRASSLGQSNGAAEGSEQDEESSNLPENSTTVDADTSTVQGAHSIVDQDSPHIEAPLPFFGDLAASTHHSHDAQNSAETSPGGSSERQPQTHVQHDLFTFEGFENIEVDGDMFPLPQLHSSLAAPGQPLNQLSLYTQNSTEKSSQSRLLDSLPNPSLRSRLIQHFVLFLCDVLIPVPGIDNPLRTIFMPIALEGARTHPKECTGATAVFHLICATSAFHLSQSPNEDKHALERIALEHYNLGISHIGQNIQSDDRTQCVAILASFIMALMVEVVNVPTTFWRLHMKGAVEWVNHVEPQLWLTTEAASKVYQMFMGITAFIESQLLLTDRDALWGIDCDLTSGSGPYTLDRIFGLPEPLFQAISGMNKLQRKLNMSPRQDMEQFKEAVDRLELELSLSAPSKPSNSNASHGDLICHHAYLYYFAMLIHMKRAIRDVPLEDVQDLIEQSLTHMEVFGTSIKEIFSPLMWTIAIIAFDACREATQERLLRCIEMLKERSQLVVWANLAEWVQQVWAFRKTKGNENLKWHESWPLSENHRFMMF